MLVMAACLTGCAAETRTVSFGPLPGGAKLLTLVVSEDLDIVRRECSQVRTASYAQTSSQVLGCQTSKPVQISGALPVRAMTIVRFAESLPSPVTFEIDAHELCHAVASLQLLPRDPCHDGNGGELQASLERIAR
jgi:hypothetical protein